MKRVSIVLWCAVAMAGPLFSGGCATIVNGKTQEISIATNPPGATAVIDDGQMCMTPGKVTLARNKDYLITITKDGFQPQVVSLNRGYPRTCLMSRMAHPRWRKPWKTAVDLS